MKQAGFDLPALRFLAAGGPALGHPVGIVVTTWPVEVKTVTNSVSVLQYTLGIHRRNFSAHLAHLVTDSVLSTVVVDVIAGPLFVLVEVVVVIDVVPLHTSVS